MAHDIDFVKNRFRGNINFVFPELSYAFWHYPFLIIILIVIGGAQSLRSLGSIRHSRIRQRVFEIDLGSNLGEVLGSMVRFCETEFLLRSFKNLVRPQFPICQHSHSAGFALSAALGAT